MAGRRGTSDWALSSSRWKTQTTGTCGVRSAVASSRAPSCRPKSLIRFVADPSGTIFPDVARKLPGRGVWVTAERSAIEAAVKQNAFAKSLKRQVTVPPDLPEAIDALFVKRLLNSLSLANKAGLVHTGAEKVEKLLDGGRAVALLHGCRRHG